MENASRALLMAVGVLIGILVLSLIVYLVSTFGNYSAQVHKEVATNQLAQFNSQFSKFDGKNDVTIYDILTLANLARENNEKYDLTSDVETNRKNQNSFYITVMVDSKYLETKDVIDQYINNKLNKLSSELLDSQDINGEMVKSLKTYKCKVDISPVTGRVYIVKFNS